MFDFLHTGHTDVEEYSWRYRKLQLRTKTYWDKKLSRGDDLVYAPTRRPNAGRISLFSESLFIKKRTQSGCTLLRAKGGAIKGVQSRNGLHLRRTHCFSIPPIQKSGLTVHWTGERAERSVGFHDMYQCIWCGYNSFPTAKGLRLRVRNKDSQVLDWRVPIPETMVYQKVLNAIHEVR